MINASKRKLSDLPALPDVSGSISMFLQKITLGIVTKKQVSGLTQEKIEYICTQAVRQAFSAQQLVLRPEGERAWKWYTIHMLADYILKTDDIIILHGMRMRIMEKLDYKEYGYIEYHAIEDYTS
jgi:hypothetical protein